MARPERRRGGRRDATLVEGSHDLNAIFPYIMKRRCDSVVYFSEAIDIENLLEFIAQKKQTDDGITFFQVFIVAIVKLLRDRNHLNRFVIGRRLYQRDDIVINFVAKREFTDESSETNVTLRVRPEDEARDVLRKFRECVRSAKRGDEKGDDKALGSLMKMPRWLLMLAIRIMEMMDFHRGIPKVLEDVDPIRCTAFVANLGSVGIEAPFHHLYEWGTNSLFIAIGRIKKMPFVNDDGSIVAKTMVEIKVTLDERIADGFYFARSLDLLKQYLNDPKSLELF